MCWVKVTWSERPKKQATLQAEKTHKTNVRGLIARNLLFGVLYSYLLNHYWYYATGYELEVAKAASGTPNGGQPVIAITNHHYVLRKESIWLIVNNFVLGLLMVHSMTPRRSIPWRGFSLYLLLEFIIPENLKRQGGHPEQWQSFLIY